MSHLIKEYDVTFSTQGKEWHGLAILPEFPEDATNEEKGRIMLETARENCCFPVIEGDLFAGFDNETVPMKDENGKGWKVILADCRDLPEHEGREIHPPALVPLHTPKQGYEALENEIPLDLIASAFDKIGIPFNLSTVGTLGNLTKFYFSIEMEGRLTDPRGHEIKPFLNFMTSHDGTMLITLKDGFVRVVCHNTFQAALSEMTDFSVTGKHTENGIRDFSELVETAITSLHTGMKRLEDETFPRMQEEKLSLEEMRATVAGYYLQPAIESGKSLDSVRLSTQARNAMEGIVSLARNGKGNGGETLYDVWNGATDYWSNGDGLGSETVGLAKRVSRSHFGSAAKHKTDFGRYAMDTEKVIETIPIAEKVLANSYAEN